MRLKGERVTSDDIATGMIQASHLAAGVAASSIGAGGVTAAMLSAAALAAVFGQASPSTGASGLGAVPVWVKYTVSAAQVAALGSSLTGDLTLDTLPANVFVQQIVWDVTTAFAGTATLKLQVGTATSGSGAYAYGGTSSGTSIQSTGYYTAAVNAMTGASTTVYANFTATTNDLSSVSAGALEVWLHLSAVA